jgi:hypothetical protein
MATRRTPAQPEKCDEELIKRDTKAARDEFRQRRLGDPLSEYESHFPTAASAAHAVVEALDQILAVPTNRAEVARLVGKKETYAALRSIAAPPISADDLKTLLDASINKTALNGDQVLADALAKLLKDCLDPVRFPWVAGARPATPLELEMAKLATAVLTTVSAIQAKRRGDERSELEGKVKDILIERNFQQVPRPQDGIQLSSSFPQPGKFMMSCTLGGHNADFVVGLLDGRILALECKASNSAVNGYKRLNKEVVVDARDWITKFGENTIVAGAALRGVFKAANVAEAQNQKVSLFWWHRMCALERFLDEARP